MANIFSASFSYFIFSSLKGDKSYRWYVLNYINRLPAKYLPGGVWQTVSRYIDLHSTGSNPELLFNLLIHESIIPSTFAFVLGLFLLILPQSLPGSFGVIVFGVVTLVGYFIFFRKVDKLLELDKKYFLYAVLCMLIVWICMGMTLLCFFSGANIKVLQYGIPHMLGSYMLSWGIGNIAIVAPQGLGVLEYAFLKLTAIEQTVQFLTIALFSYRVINIISDLILWFVVQISFFIRACVKYTSDSRDK